MMITDKSHTRIQTASIMIFIITLLFSANTSRAQVVRIWPEAVVVDDVITLKDIADFQGFDRSTEQSLKESVLVDAPNPGGSKNISIAQIRQSLQGNEINLSTVRIGGATTCSVSRPDAIVQESSGKKTKSVTISDRISSRLSSKNKKTNQSLRERLQGYFSDEFSHINGKPDVTYENAVKTLFDLREPDYRFSFQSKSQGNLGKRIITVQIIQDESIQQEIVLRCHVRLIRNVVTAVLPVNRGTVIADQDVKLVEHTFSSLKFTGIDSLSLVVGKKAKKFVQAGSVVQSDDLEQIPLVNRGDLVMVKSVVGGISVVSSAKAMEDGFLGDTIRVRDQSRKRIELSAVVTGVGKVQVSG